MTALQVNVLCACVDDGGIADPFCEECGGSGLVPVFEPEAAQEEDSDDVG